ncbi:MULTISPECIES: hypothetical protein [unclassified Streptomyces]|uniref:hypothetical protein n=1 Tax=unclassified Streptomyces TaxID=2593676 RepID=UPI00068E8F02|nr:MULTISPECIES: hypothetical protein [unclassified Streptomyces]
MAALAMGALAMAPPASAAAPTTATVQVNCGDWGTGKATLGAQGTGGRATVTFTTPVVWASHSIPADSLRTTLTLSTANGKEVTLAGQSNPAWTLLGQPYASGPVTGTVTPGEPVQFKSLTSTYGTLTVHCVAVSAQSPGPFVF